MIKIKYLLLIFVSAQCFSQISGNVTDSVTELPIDYVNIWVKNTRNGTTTNSSGNFNFESGKVGDTLLISYLGYKELQFLAQKENTVKLIPNEIELAEILIIPMRNTQIKSINSYNKSNSIKEFYYNGHYSLARFYKYKEEYEQSPFINKVSLVVLSALKNKVTFKVHLIKADKEGKPSDQILSEYYVLKTGKGKNEITIDFSDEKLIFPETGFFVVIDRLNLEENKFSNKLATDILQPAIGMEKEASEKNTWLGYSGKWIEPKELIKYAGSNKNIAIKIELTD